LTGKVRTDNEIDSHCYSRLRLPYQPPVPDDQNCGTVARLLQAMNLRGLTWR